MDLCLCSCNKKVSKPGNKYIRGHNPVSGMRGKHHSEEWKREKSLQQKKMWQNPSYREGMHLAHIGHPNLSKGKSRSKETVEKIRKAQTKLWQDPKYRERQIKALLKGMKLKREAPEYQEYRKHLSESLQGRHFSKEWKRKISLTKIESWKDPTFRKKMIKALFKGNKKRPTKPEKKLRRGLNKLFPGEYKYVGDGQFIIGGRNPDFINVNSQKKIIELFGDYWHGKKRTGRTRKQEENRRIKYFAEYGYKTLIVWERELQNIPRLKRRLIEFHMIKKEKAIQIKRKKRYL